jgi:hypothetical protein
LFEQSIKLETAIEKGTSSAGRRGPDRQSKREPLG